MVAAIQYVTKPSDFATEMLVTGVGLALIAAVCSMAAGFQRNIKAGIDAKFTGVGLLSAYTGAIFVVVGTIESLGKTDVAVTVVACTNLALAVLAVITALKARLLRRLFLKIRLFYRRDIRSSKDARCVCVRDEEEIKDRASNASQPVAKVKDCPRVAAQENGVDDGQQGVEPAETGTKRGSSGWACSLRLGRIALAFHAQTMPRRSLVWAVFRFASVLPSLSSVRWSAMTSAKRPRHGCSSTSTTRSSGCKPAREARLIYRQS